MSGRIGASAVTVGALVTANQSSPLAVIQQIDRVYIDITQSSAEAIRLRRALAQGRMSANGNAAKIRLTLEDGSPYTPVATAPHAGESAWIQGDLLFSEISVAQSTGSIMADTEQYDLLIDNSKAGAYGLTRAEINSAISAYWAGEYINDFSDKGRTKKVYFQAEPSVRSGIGDFRRFYLRNTKDEMVPFSSFIGVKSVLASPSLTRYQGIPSVKIEGAAAPGQSTGQAMGGFLGGIGLRPQGRAMASIAAACPYGQGGRYLEVAPRLRKKMGIPTKLLALTCRRRQSKRK